MPAKAISLEFNGYWRDTNKAGVPAQAGVYAVYTGRYNTREDAVALLRLVYIGQATNARDRIKNHEKRPDWIRYLAAGEELCYSFSPVTINRDRSEAALIYEHKPPVNADFTNCFPFDNTTLNLSGKTALLTSVFTVQRKEC